MENFVHFLQHDLEKDFGLDDDAVLLELQVSLILWIVPELLISNAFFLGVTHSLSFWFRERITLNSL